MKQIKFIIFSIILLLSKPLFSQDIKSIIENCKKEVNQINNLTFEKTVLQYATVSKNDDISFPSYRDVNENMSYIYKDNEEKIRKFLTMWNHVEWSGYEVHYFDTTGNVVCSYIYNRTCMSSHSFGYRYMSDGKQIFCDMDVYDEYKDFSERITYSEGEILLTYCRGFDAILHTDSIMPFCKFLRYLNISGTDFPTEKVRFVYPEKGAKTIINARGVNIREKSNTNSSAILVPRFGEIVEILKKGREENIDPFGKNNWFKVKVNNKIGYIFGAFLEPIEKIIE
jgi:hypothetical protein